MSLDPIEEIKSRLDIVELVKSYIPLQHAGANFKACCPFHREKSGSFMVSPTKQIWHCFGCGEGGDLFSFFMKQEGLEFGEALRVLAERAGVKLERQDPRLADERQRLFDLLDLASQYYHQALLRAPQAEEARVYVGRRGLDATLIDEFRVGYALADRGALSKFLLSRKHSAQELIAAGLAIRTERGYGLLDRFHDRLMVPIRNVHGAVAGFGGRTLDQSVSAKYINSPQTLLYDKSRVVFGLDKAKQDIRQKDSVVIVEGYMDVFAVYGSGMHNVVATSGTALTIEQVRLLKRYTLNLSFAFDTDVAGSQATMRGVELALGEGMNVRVILLPKENGVARFKDPDECVRADATIWETAVANAKPFVEFYFDAILTPQTHADPFKKKTAARKILTMIARIPDSIEQDHWIKQLTARLQISEQILWEALRALAQTAEKAVAPVDQKGTQPQDRISAETTLLALILKYPFVFEEIKPLLSEGIWENSDNHALYNSFRDVYTTGEQELVERVKTVCPTAPVDTLILLADKDFDGLDEKALKRVGTELAHSISSASLRRQMTALQARMHQAEQDKDSAAMEECLREFNRLQAPEKHC